ncbi:MAG: S41 family peptidase, partial [Patescibacteria group bacterium]|nr:S41 family peptidase [Patescibacteria group bacterium]
YQTIQDNYWQKLNDQDLTQLFVLATERITGTQLGAGLNSPDQFEEKLIELLAEHQTEQKKIEFVTQLADVVLANLQPAGRSRLYSKQKTKELGQRVANINPETDHYQELEVDKNADENKVKEAYQEKKQELENQASPSAQQKLKKVEEAYQTLANDKNRERYDEAGISPTMEWRLISPSIFYLKIKKFSPTTIQELTEVTQKVDQGDKLDSLILDLRGNVGGAIDGLPYFLGPFIGPNQYAYQFIQQGDVTDFKTKTGWLPSLKRYKKTAVLINDQTQSSAEVMASVLKKYNVGNLVGTTTKGWGTIEKVFSLENQLSQDEEYSLFLVHHLTLRADGQPIESNGVEPVVSVSQANWQKELASYFDHSDLVEAITKQFE